MKTIDNLQDINWELVEAVAYGEEPLQIAPSLLAVVENGRNQFESLIAAGIPCYGVTTGLGQLVSQSLSEAEIADLPHNILRARAVAIGPPLKRPVVRTLMLLKLTNFLSGQDGVRPKLVRFLVARLNDGFTPWVPWLGHGMGADAIAHTHAFQTFIGEGFVLGVDGQRMPAADALALRSVEPLRLAQKEGLALLNGVAAAPALAIDAHRKLTALLCLATAVSAVSAEGVAAPKSFADPALLPHLHEDGIKALLHALQPYFANSQIVPTKLQAAISFRIIPQLHGALADALAAWRKNIEAAMQSFSDNPLLVGDGENGRFLSVGLFHNQHLVNTAEQVAVALAHVAMLSVRRLHRLVSPRNVGLPPQLAARPGLDAGLVVAHKAALGLGARVRHLAQPLSLATDESSAGQEDYMSLALPVISRLYEMVELTEIILAYELLGGLMALAWRGEQAGDGVRAIQTHFSHLNLPYRRDKSPSWDVENILAEVKTAVFQQLIVKIENQSAN